MLIVAGGLIYTIDRGVHLIADMIRFGAFKVGFEIREVESYQFGHMKFTFDNPFGWAFLILGVSILILSYILEIRAHCSIKPGRGQENG